MANHNFGLNSFANSSFQSQKDKRHQ